MTNNGHKQLAPQHQKLIADSAIAVDVRADRGYWTATKAIELQRLGFSNVQSIVPSLVVPLHGLDGEVVGYQHGPDMPRVVDGRALKYESPAGTSAVLDVPSRYRDEIRRGTGAIWITEGSRKADAATSVGLYCVSISGVWSWLRSKDNTVLPDLLRIRWTDRKAVIAFDSDVMVNPSVHAALEKLTKWLESQGADPHCLYLPNSDDAKLGLDDAIAAGYTTDRLWEYVEPGVRAFRAEPKGAVLPTAALLLDLTRYLRRYVRFADERAQQEVLILALFVLHTWCFTAAHATAYLYVKSPAKRAGKTRLLEVLEAVCRDALLAGSITAASVFQTVEKKQPTLLVDEVDALFAGPSEYAEALRQVLNTGYRPSGKAVRGTQDGEPREFSTYCPKVLAGIDNSRLPDTVVDRSLVIRLERKLKDEQVARLRQRKVAGQLEEFRGRLADWAMLATDRLIDYETPMIEEISDRAEEIAEPLLAIADDAGPEWLTLAREAVMAVAAADDGADDHGLLVLAKLAALFGEHGPRIASKALVVALREDENLPFEDITANRVAALVKPYGLRPRVIRTADGTPRPNGGGAREGFSRTRPALVLRGRRRGRGDRR